MPLPIRSSPRRRRVNRWFNHVELVAADKIHWATINHVSDIYKHYTAYKLLVAQDEERLKAREGMTKG